MSKTRNLRTKRAVSEEPEEDAAAGGEPELLRDKLEDTRLLQKFRKRTAGYDATRLPASSAGPSAASAADKEEDVDHEHEQQRAALMDTYVKAKAVTATEEEDKNMKKFIEQELAKRLGKRAAGDGGDEAINDAEAKRRAIEQQLYEVPQQYRTKPQAETEGGLPGVLAGITEVQLTAAQRLHNFEAVEAAKHKILMASKGLPVEDDAKDAAKAAVRRGMVPAIFGAHVKKPKTEERAREKEELRRKVITDRPAPYHGGRHSGGRHGGKG